MKKKLITIVTVALIAITSTFADIHTMICHKVGNGYITDYNSFAAASKGEEYYEDLALFVADFVVNKDIFQSDIDSRDCSISFVTRDRGTDGQIYHFLVWMDLEDLMEIRELLKNDRDN